MNELKVIQKEYQKLSLFLIDIIGKRQIFHRIRKNWKKFELSNKLIALNILYVPYNTEEVRHAYKSKHNLKHDNQVSILMITDGKNWHYFAVKKLQCKEHCY